MIYELHITVDHNDPDFDLGEWVGLCDALGIKPLDIRLHGGGDITERRQVMFAAVHEGDSESVHEWMIDLTQAVMEGGFSIRRSKLEVPLDKSGWCKNPAYHECHVKSLIPEDLVDVTVPRVVQAGWMASYNDLYKSAYGLEKWYFTQRNYADGFIQAGREFAESFNSLTTLNWHTVRMESETVWKDTNPEIDEGWA